MIRSKCILLLSATLIVVATFSGCADPQPASMADDLDQAAIDAYKDAEKQIELDAMNDMDLGE